MKGYIHWLPNPAGILRVGSGVHGGPFDWSVVVERESDDLAAIHGLASTITMAHWRAGNDALKGNGFKAFRFWRIEGGVWVPHYHVTR